MNLAKNRECAQLHREMNSLSSTVNQRKRCRGKRKQHISGYEPFYLIADTELPNAKFQASIKHQLLNSESRLLYNERGGSFRLGFSLYR